MSRETILLFGKNGQLGSELNNILAPVGNLVPIDRKLANFENPDSIVNLIRQTKPKYIINAVAYTNVDFAETEPDLARKINGVAPGILAEEAKLANAILIHYSTDYVFDGVKRTPYTEEDVPNPLNIYGLSKLDGEQAIRDMTDNHLIFRTSWVYSLTGQTSFVNKVLRWLRQEQRLLIVADQISNPSWAHMLAEITGKLLKKNINHLRECSGIYHLAGNGFTSRFEWAKLIMALDPNRKEQVVKEILPAYTMDFPSAAHRPRFSALDCQKFSTVFDLKLPEWKNSLELAFSSNESISNSFYQ